MKFIRELKENEESSWYIGFAWWNPMGRGYIGTYIFLNVILSVGRNLYHWIRSGFRSAYDMGYQNGYNAGRRYHNSGRK